MTTTVPAPGPTAVRALPLRCGLALVALVLLVLTAGVLTAPAAEADDSAGRISWMDITADLAAEGGTARVAVDLELDLGSEEAHGPYLVLAELQEIVGDPDHYRRLEVTDITATSETAPDDLRVEREGGAVHLYVGDEDTEITGAHTYRLEYAVTGLINPDVDGTDELYWNVVAPGGFEIPIDDVTVAVTGPADPVRSACYVGATGSDDPCPEVRTVADTVELRGGALGEEQGLSVVVAWPAGTFHDAEPQLVHRYTATNVLQLTPVTGALTGGAVLAGLALVLVTARVRGRDEAYLGLTPGLEPYRGETVATGPAPRTAVTVRFTPPDGVRPGEVGTLADEVAHDHDVTATIVDLAVRGYLRVEEVPAEGEDGDDDRHDPAAVEDWRLVRLRTDTDDLEAYEAALLERIFADHDSPTLKDLGNDLAATVASSQSDLYTTVTERGWFRASPRKVRNRWVVRGLVVLGVGLVAVPVLWLTRLPVILALAPILLGVVVMVASAAMPARTASGTAVLAQALGFRQYLETAEANQIRFEEGEDIFSRYLPWAIAFGLTERWAELVAEAAAQGRTLPDPAWYVGAHGALLWSRPDRLTASVGAFTAAATAVTTASSGAGGSSGFSGGSVGGGVGGMGGGSW